MAGDERLREFLKLKAERDKGRWTDDEYRQLIAAIREGVEHYRQVRQVVSDNRETATDTIRKPISDQRKTRPISAFYSRVFFIVITTSAVIGVILGLPAPPPPIPEPVSQPKKKTEWEIAEETARCRRDLECWGERNLSAATVKCASRIERQAKFSFEWTDEWLESKISRFRWEDQGRGVITYIGDKIKLQNGFGAWAPYIYTCDFDTTNEIVLNVHLIQGRLP
jgi:hypothetical protein